MESIWSLWLCWPTVNSGNDICECRISIDVHRNEKEIFPLLEADCRGSWYDEAVFLAGNCNGTVWKAKCIVPMVTVPYNRLLPQMIRNHIVDV